VISPGPALVAGPFPANESTRAGQCTDVVPDLPMGAVRAVNPLLLGNEQFRLRHALENLEFEFEFGFLVCGHDVRRAAKNNAVRGFAELGDGANAICRIITAVVAAVVANAASFE
jgi:hypothetical protein